ncbi:MAG: alkaline phosphatase family protein [Sedimentisphaerales bacterium]|nr:alkaline phosphatase family protein [Sedimentisphaerales bacterium]
MPTKFMVLSIDGVPYWLMEKMFAEGVMPNLAKVAAAGRFSMMKSVQPTVSSVAWACYATGVNPGIHGNYGFIDRTPGSWDLQFPNNATMTAEHIWTKLTKAGKRVFGMNVPSTYPPKPVNGVLIGCFLAPSIDKVVYPASEVEYLKSIDYQIDSDAGLARQDKRAMLANLDYTLDKRFEALFHYLDQENWDFFHTHVMGSDRINHFLWEKMETGDKEFSEGFFKFYTRIDNYIGQLLAKIGDEVPLMVFSDHGFCKIKYEVQMCRWLIDNGWMKPAEQLRSPLSIDPYQTRAYVMIPGRFYVNLAGREPGGIVPLADYEKTRQELKGQLLAMKDPQGNAVIEKVLMREEVYWPEGATGPGGLTPEQVATAGGTYGRACDLIAVPYDGYDLKLGINLPEVFVKTALEGMHTYPDAFMVARGIDLPDDLEITNLSERIIKKVCSSSIPA